MQEKNSLFLIDAMSMIYRAYFALQKTPVYNSKGLNTSAILGFANMILDILKNEQPTHIGVCFDSKAPTFRHEEFENYKAQREAMPEDISKAIPYIKKLLEIMSIPVFAMDGFEADDLVGTLAKKAEKNNFTVFMVTSDKDFGQLVSENVFIYKPGKFGQKPEIMGVEQVCQKFSIKYPEQLTDILGLWGDASDNIPGVPGIGEVKAVKLIQQFETIELLKENSDSIENTKLKLIIKEHIDKAVFSKKLATIAIDVPLDFDPKKLLWEVPDSSQLIPFLNELEFRQFSKRLFDFLYADKPQLINKNHGIQGELFNQESSEESKDSITNIIPVQYIVISSLHDFAQLIEQLLKCSCFSFDTVVTGPNPFEDKIIGISFCLQEAKAYFIPFDKGYFSLDELSPFLQQVFDLQQTLKIAHDIKFDYRMLKKHGILMKPPFFDTKIAHYLLYPEVKHDLNFLVESYFNTKISDLEDLTPFNNLFSDDVLRIPHEQLSNFCSTNADYTFRLKLLFERELTKNSMSELLNNLEIPLFPVLSAMEEEGIRINTSELKEFSMKIDKKILSIETDVFDLCGIKFNLASPKQLGEVLFEKLKISDKPPRTKTKQYSTGEDILSKYKEKHPVIPFILEHRTLTKLKTTYIDTLPNYIQRTTGRIHTIFNQAVTATGRLSSNNPNLQNIPIRTDEGQEIRKAFIPRNSDYVLMSADYSQIELRIIAALSKDINMIADFERGLDIHKATAARIYSIPVEEVNAVQRRNAKTVNFGIIYGISAFGLSERLTIPRKESEQLIEEYFRQYPGVRQYMDELIAIAREKGYVETVMKRRRLIPNITSSNAYVRGLAERSAINAPIQGSAADIIKLAMIHVHNRIFSENLNSRMLLQVHDELVFDVCNSEITVMTSLVREEMLKAFCFDIPVEVDIRTGRNWLEAH